MQRDQGKFCGGRRAFGYAIIDGVKVPNDDEQQVILHMRQMKSTGASLRDIQTWLEVNQGRSFSRMGVRDILGRAG
jgi:hypothetical protein